MQQGFDGRNSLLRFRPLGVVLDLETAGEDLAGVDLYPPADGEVELAVVS